jgi:hypothetical protein
MELTTTTKSGTKVILKGLPCDEITITIPQGVFKGYWGSLNNTEGFVCRGVINGKETMICAQIPLTDWNTFTAGIKAELHNNVPGLKELQDAIDAEIAYANSFDEMMEDEQNDGVLPPTLPTTNASDVATKYPRAAAYIKAEAFEDSNHHVKASAGKKAKKLIAQGHDHITAIEAMEKEWEEHCRNAID